MARLDSATPLEARLPFESAGGCVVITRFECENLAQLLLLIGLHLRVKGHVRRRVSGLVASRIAVEWKRRTLLSISLWSEADGLYSMGAVPQHVRIARLPRQLGIRTACGVYRFAGDWRNVMFGATLNSRFPLKPLSAHETYEEES